jgi:hypothetical protein
MSECNKDEVFQSGVRSILKEGLATVIFTKKDGTERVMKCTLNGELIPEEFIPKETTKVRKVNEEVISVFDIEFNGWKSFRWDSVKKVSVFKN